MIATQCCQVVPEHAPNDVRNGLAPVALADGSPAHDPSRRPDRSLSVSHTHHRIKSTPCHREKDRYWPTHNGTAQ